MPTRPRRAALPLLLALALAGCASVPRARETGQLVFWRVSRADGTGGHADVLGSMHVAKERLAFDPAIERALAADEELVLEVAPEEIGGDEAQRLISERGRLPEGKTLADVVSPETLAAVVKRLDQRALPLATWLGWEPWALSLALASDALQGEGFRREEGVERRLAADAQAARKPARGFETTREQIERLDALPPETQELLLRDAVIAPKRAGSVAALETAWRRGDLAAIAREIFASPTGPGAAAYFEAVYFARNRDFADDIARGIDAGRRWFVAIGAGHMVGEQGIPQLLAARGYRVERVPKTRPGAEPAREEPPP